MCTNNVMYNMYVDDVDHILYFTYTLLIHVCCGSTPKHNSGVVEVNNSWAAWLLKVIELH